MRYGRKKVNFVLPTIYSDALSYYEELCKLRRELVEVAKLSLPVYVHHVELYSEVNDLYVHLTIEGYKDSAYKMSEISEIFDNQVCMACVPVSSSLDIGVIKKLPTGKWCVFGADLLGSTQVYYNIDDFVVNDDEVEEKQF